MTATVASIDARLPLEELAGLIGRAAQDLGFLSLSHTGLNADKMFAISRNFFSNEALDVKMAHTITTKNVGYSQIGQESLDPSRPGDFKEVFNFGLLCGNQDSCQPLPPSLMIHKEAILEFQQQCHQFCQTLLKALALALGLDSGVFAQEHHFDSKNPSILRLLRYPASGGTASAPRAGAHSDYGSITLLFTENNDSSAGLQLLPPSSNSENGWVDVPVQPDEESVLVNIGDALEYWTGARLRSTLHRVVDKGRDKDRYSIAFFYQPDPEAILEAVLPTFQGNVTYMENKGIKAGQVFTAMAHLQARLAATYTGRKDSA